MKKLIFLLILNFLLLSGYAVEPIPRFKKYDISNSGCAIYMPAEPDSFSVSYSEDVSKLWTNETNLSNFTFGIICVKFKDDIPTDQLESVLESYLDYLKTAYSIESSAGYGKGHTLTSNPEAKGMIDYWKDADKNDYSVKGWIDAKYLAVLYIYGKGEYPYFNAQQMYLEGFRFPSK